MKRIIAIFLFVVLCVFSCGCRTTEKQNQEAKLVLTQVLNKEKSFTIHNFDVNKTSEQILEKFWFPWSFDVTKRFTPFKYAFCDFDADGIEELIVMDYDLVHYLFLRYEDGKVYGYIHRFIGVYSVRTDGSFFTYEAGYNSTVDEYKGYEAISNISFSGDSYKITHKAYKNVYENKYLLNNEPADKTVVEEYFDDWENNAAKVSWQKLNS